MKVFRKIKSVPRVPRSGLPITRKPVAPGPWEGEPGLLLETQPQECESNIAPVVLVYLYFFVLVCVGW